MALLSSLDLIEHEENSRVQTRHETVAENTSKLCAGCCDKVTSRRCSHCGGALFCSQACELKMCLSHLLKCNMRQVTSADYLFEDVLADEPFTDPQLRQDYWFDRCETKFEESHLRGVFAGLVHYHPNRITREELHQWRSDPGGNPYLVAKIVNKFEELSDNNRGRYFPWFLRHRAIFELPDGHHAIPRAPSPTTEALNIEARARQYLAPEDQHKDFKEFTPFAKRHCFGFYAMAVNHSRPPPLNREHCRWFDFGFVVCHDQHEEEELGSMYDEMLCGSMYHEEYAQSIGSSTMGKWARKRDPTCSFDEFWKAWESGVLTTIFKKHWPDSRTENTATCTWLGPDLITRLYAFLEAETPRPSIWSLLHFLAMEDVSVEFAAPGIAQAARDYGFSEQLDARTTLELRLFYGLLLKKAEPLTVHRERMEGNMVQFAEGHVETITPGVMKLLQGLL